MDRRTWFRGLAGVGASALTTSPAFGDDFGKFLERTAKDALRDGLKAPLSPNARGGEAASADPIPVNTPDGWTLVVHRYRPAGQPLAGVPPVILCHGLSYSALFWDLDPSCSLARWLSGRGYDVWAVSLRGSGMSRKWVAKLDTAPQALLDQAIRKLAKGKLGPHGYASLDPKYARWNLDDHITYDVPTVVGLVRRQTRAAEVAWIGHSMGGIVALGHLCRFANPGIGRLIAIGSQVTMDDRTILLQLVGELLKTRQLQLGQPLDMPGLVDTAKTGVNSMFFNRANTLPTIYDALSTYAQDIPSIDLLKQYQTMADRGELLNAQGNFSYARQLANVKVPILVGCGATDRLAPPKVQKDLYVGVGSTDKTAIIFGRSHGFSADCGHDDTLVGLNSQAEVYPVLDAWLRGERNLVARPAPAAPPPASTRPTPVAPPPPPRFALPGLNRRPG